MLLSKQNEQSSNIYDKKMKFWKNSTRKRNRKTKMGTKRIFPVLRITVKYDGIIDV